jgi:hypothetical protein
MKRLVLFTLLSACTPAPVVETRPPPPKPAQPRFPVEGELLPGDHCTAAVMPAWRLDSASHTVTLPAADFHMKLPAGFSAAIDRPDLIVVSAPPSSGVQTAFEIYVSPVCKRYQVKHVQARMAGRGLITHQAADKTAADFAAMRGFSAGLGGPVGLSLIVNDVAFGEHHLGLIATDIAAAKTFGIHAAAVCPRAEYDRCSETYFAMLKSSQ